MPEGERAGAVKSGIWVTKEQPPVTLAISKMLISLQCIHIKYIHTTLYLFILLCTASILGTIPSLILPE